MFVRGYALNVSNSAKIFLKNNKQKEFQNKPFSYIVKLNDKIKIGSCNNLYNRISTYDNMYKNVELLNVRGFPTDPTNEFKYNKIFSNRLAKINGDSFHHDAINEVSILKSVKDLTNNKFKILDMDH